MKVFISYSNADLEFAESLASRIRAQGHEPWLAAIDVEPGGNFVRGIHRALSDSALLLLLWCREAASSNWVEAEWTTMLKQEIEDCRTRVLVILVRDAPLPGLLAAKEYIDARENREAALSMIVERLGRLTRLGQQAGRCATTYLVDESREDFVGRATYLEKLFEMLAEAAGAALLYGPPGSGKSSLAVKFARDFQGAFQAVVLVRCGRRPYVSIIRELAMRIEMDTTHRSNDGQRLSALKIYARHFFETPEHTLKRVASWCAGRRTLMILDDISPASDADRFRVRLRAPSVSFLCTSRHKSLSSLERRNCLEVRGLTGEEADLLFSTYLGPDDARKNREPLFEFWRLVDGLPIAIAVFAELLRREFNPIPETVRSMVLEQLRNEVHDVPGLFRRAISACPAPQQILLLAMAGCDPSGFTLSEAAARTNLTESEVRSARDGLLDCCLLQSLDRNQQRFRLHTLVRRTVIDEQNRDIMSKRPALSPPTPWSLSSPVQTLEPRFLVAETEKRGGLIGD